MQQRMCHEDHFRQVLINAIIKAHALRGTDAAMSLMSVLCGDDGACVNVSGALCDFCYRGHCDRGGGRAPPRFIPSLRARARNLVAPPPPSHRYQDSPASRGAAYVDGARR